jgi:cation diffusion facilitator family transporter
VQIKNDFTKDPIKAGFFGGIISIIINTALFIIKMWAAIASNSLAISADAWHTMSDSVSSVVVIIATKLADREKDKKHPFGYGRWDLIGSLFIAVVLGIISYEFIVKTIKYFSLSHTVNYGVLAITITISSIIVKEILTQYTFFLAKKSQNNSLIADAWHHRSDSLSSFAILIGIFLAKKFNLYWIDGILSFIVSLMLIYATLKVLKTTTTKLLGEAAPPSFIDDIKKELTQAFGTDYKIHNCNIHDYVVHKEFICHIRLDNDMLLNDSYIVTEQIKTLLLEKFNILATLHVEPLERYEI